MGYYHPIVNGQYDGRLQTWVATTCSPDSLTPTTSDRIWLSTAMTSCWHPHVDDALSSKVLILHCICRAVLGIGSVYVHVRNLLQMCSTNNFCYIFKLILFLMMYASSFSSSPLYHLYASQLQSNSFVVVQFPDLRNTEASCTDLVHGFLENVLQWL